MKVSLAAILSVGFLPTYFATSLTFIKVIGSYKYSCSIIGDKPAQNCFNLAAGACKATHSTQSSGAVNPSQECISSINQIFNSFSSGSTWRAFGDNCIAGRKSTSGVAIVGTEQGCSDSTTKLLKTESYLSPQGIKLPVTRELVNTIIHYVGVKQ